MQDLDQYLYLSADPDAALNFTVLRIPIQDPDWEENYSCKKERFIHENEMKEIAQNNVEKVFW